MSKVSPQTKALPSGKTSVLGGKFPFPSTLSARIKVLVLARAANLCTTAILLVADGQTDALD
jgi:hypothetical protein